MYNWRRQARSDAEAAFEQYFHSQLRQQEHAHLFRRKWRHSHRPRHFHGRLSRSLVSHWSRLWTKHRPKQWQHFCNSRWWWQGPVVWFTSFQWRTKRCGPVSISFSFCIASSWWQFPYNGKRQGRRSSMGYSSQETSGNPLWWRGCSAKLYECPIQL